jgi:hypothetical protein
MGSLRLTATSTIDLDGLRRRILAAAARGVEAACAELLVAHSKPICPIDTGALRRSGRVEACVVTPDEVRCQVAYGGGAVDYAVYVHEILHYRHAPPTQAKFLEQPALEHGPRLLAEHVRGAVLEEVGRR